MTGRWADFIRPHRPWPYALAPGRCPTIPAMNCMPWAERQLRWVRLSPPGEKAGRKPMAEMAVVYDAAPVPAHPSRHHRRSPPGHRLPACPRAAGYGKVADRHGHQRHPCGHRRQGPTKRNAAIPATSAPRSPSPAGTTSRSRRSRPKPAAGTSPFPSSATSSMSSNTCRRPPGHSSSPATQMPRNGPPPKPSSSSRANPAKCRRDPPPRQHLRLLPARTRRRRRLRGLPEGQGTLPGLPHRPGPRLAHRHRSHQRRMPLARSSSPPSSNRMTPLHSRLQPCPG